MANIFPKWTNRLPLQIILGAVLLGATVVAGVSYYATPKYTRVGYMPQQPVPFDHSLHVTQLGMDCRYCHTGVEISSHSNVPTTQTCMNCHTQIQPTSARLAPVRESWQTGEPIRWVKIHKAPDYVYFNHAVHVNRGVSCVSCHGNIDQMQVVWHDQPQSMGWCLECHRSPEQKIRPVEKVFDLTWKPEKGGLKPNTLASLEKAGVKINEQGGVVDQNKMGEHLVSEWQVKPPTNCAGCHR